jgi:hypothetical protein
MAKACVYVSLRSLRSETFVDMAKDKDTCSPTLQCLYNRIHFLTMHLCLQEMVTVDNAGPYAKWKGTHLGIVCSTVVYSDFYFCGLKCDNFWIVRRKHL